MDSFVYDQQGTYPPTGWQFDHHCEYPHMGFHYTPSLPSGCEYVPVGQYQQLQPLSNNHCPYNDIIAGTQYIYDSPVPVVESPPESYPSPVEPLLQSHHIVPSQQPLVDSIIERRRERQHSDGLVITRQNSCCLQEQQPQPRQPQTSPLSYMDHLPYPDNYASPASHYPSPTSPTDFSAPFVHQQEINDVMVPSPNVPWMQCPFDTFCDHQHQGPTQVGAAGPYITPESPPQLHLPLHASQTGSSWPDPASAPFSASSSSLSSHVEAQAQAPAVYSRPYTNQIEFRHHPQSAIPSAESIMASTPPSPANTTGASSTTATSPVASSGDHASIAIRLSPLPGPSREMDVEVSSNAGSSSGADGCSSNAANVNMTTNGNGNRKPPLACLFCRGRKIACGPPPPESTDKTCNQCFRRQLKCEYPSESRRGMRKKKHVHHAGPKVTIKTGRRTNSS